MLIKLKTSFSLLRIIECIHYYSNSKYQFGFELNTKEIAQQTVIL